MRYDKTMAGSALVLGSGGITGIAWEVGLLAGLADRGLVLSGAGLIIGTSAGAIVGTQVACGASPAALYQAQLAPPDGETGATMSAVLKLRYALTLAGSLTPVRARMRFGRIAAGSPALPEATRKAVIAARLPSHEWPARPLIITAVDAGTGEGAAFTASSGVSLVDAVSASCAVPGVWPPVTINGRRWMDGGMRSPTNADLAAGHDRIVIIAPIGQGFRRVLPSAPRHAAHLARAGHAVTVVVPDRAALAAIGGNMLDPARRAAAAQAGYRQAAAVAAQVARVWEAPIPGTP
jgi:NTE family protein